MTAADVAYVEANYLSFEEACAGRPEALEQVRAVAAAGQLPQPSYVLPDGTEMVPADYFAIADAGRDVFEREFLAAGGSPDEVDAEWDGYRSGAYGVCLKEQTPSPRRSRARAAGAPASGRRSTSSTSWSGRSRRTTTGPAGARALATAASRRRGSAFRRSSLQPSPALPDLNRIAHMAIIQGLAPVLIVPEVPETLEHYRDKLGFETREWEPNPAAYGYAQRDECHIHFNQGEQPRPNSEVVQPDLFDVYLWVDNVAALHEEFVARGADLLHEPIERPWGMLEIRIQDPNGYILAFGQRTA